MSPHEDPICIALRAMRLRVTALTEVRPGHAAERAVAGPGMPSCHPRRTAVPAGGAVADDEEARTRALMRTIFGAIDEIELPLAAPAGRR